MSFKSIIVFLFSCTVGAMPVVSATSVEPPFFTVSLAAGVASVTRSSNNAVIHSGADHQAVIQYALDNLPANRTAKSKVLLIGDFQSDDTILIPSYTTLELRGSVTLKEGVFKQLINQSTPKTGNTQIEITGGVYDGNKYKNQKTPMDAGYYLILFSRVTHSDFSNFIAQNCGSDAFILDTYCNNNRVTGVTGRGAGIPEVGVSNGNGLGDRGNNNTWVDCVTEDTYSDGWVIKCQNSTFINCIARRGATGAGFGLFGDRPITGNKFYNCEVSGFTGRGVTLRKPSDPKKGNDPISDNTFQIYVHDNGVENLTEQVGFRLWSSRAPVDAAAGEMITRNHVDLLIQRNHEYGFLIKDEYVSHTTGTVVIMANTIDAKIEGYENDLTFLVPDITKAKIVTAGKNNKVQVRQITPADAQTSWAAKKYYEQLAASK